MYKEYAFQAGFDIRKGSLKKTNHDVVTSRHLLCNREGKPNTGNVDTIDVQIKKTKRRKDLHRTECKAHIVFRIIPGGEGYYVYDFVERHNHRLISKANMYLSRASRELDFSQKSYVYNMTKQNVGGGKAYRLMTGIQGGCSSRGGLAIDYKNYMRNLN